VFDISKSNILDFCVFEKAFKEVAKAIIVIILKVGF